MQSAWQHAAPSRTNLSAFAGENRPSPLEKEVEPDSDPLPLGFPGNCCSVMCHAAWRCCSLLSRVTGKNQSQVNISTCKTLDDVSSLLKSIMKKYRRLVCRFPAKLASCLADSCCCMTLQAAGAKQLRAEQEVRPASDQAGTGPRCAECNFASAAVCQSMQRGF